MEIKVGEYVRTKEGKIIRFKKIGTYKTHTRKIDGKYERGTFENKCIISGRYHYKYDNISKHSKNIIDLIEVGDYVNGYKVLEIRRNDNRILIGVYKDTETVIYKTLANENVKTILTHEQFKQNAYRLEGK